MLTKIFYNYQLHHIGAKLSGCQTVRFYYVVAKFSAFDSRCQIVLQSRISFLTTMVAGGGGAVVFCTNFVSHTISMHVVFVKCSKPVHCTNISQQKFFYLLLTSQKTPCTMYSTSRLKANQTANNIYHVLACNAVQCTNNYT